MFYIVDKSEDALFSLFSQQLRNIILIMMMVVVELFQKARDICSGKMEKFSFGKLMKNRNCNVSLKRKILVEVF